MADVFYTYTEDLFLGDLAFLARLPLLVAFIVLCVWI